MRPTPSYELYIDGASHGNPGPAGIGVVVLDLSAAPNDRRNPGGASASPAENMAGDRQAGGTDKPVAQFSKYLGETTNNVAETCALILALQEALILGHRDVTVLTDSELLARQVSGIYKVKDPRLRLLHVLIRQLLQGFQKWEVQHIPREKNRQADRLANQAVNEGLKKESPQQTFW